MDKNKKNIIDREDNLWDSTIERRRAQRCKFIASADYYNGRKRPIYKKMVIRNISSSGILLSGYGNFQAGDKIDITFKAPFCDFREITLSGTIARINIDKKTSMMRIGVEFNRNVYKNRIDSFVKDVNSN